MLKLYDCVKNCPRFKSRGRNGFADNFSFLRRSELGIRHILSQEFFSCERADPALKEEQLNNGFASRRKTYFGDVRFHFPAGLCSEPG